MKTHGIFNKVLLLAGLLLPGGVFADVQDFPEVACSTYDASITQTCNQCFQGGGVYTNKGFRNFRDVFNNRTGDKKVIFFDNGAATRFDVLQPGTSWFVSNNFTKYDSALPYYTSKSGRAYTYVPENTDLKIIQTDSDAGIILQSVTSADRSKPAFRLTFDITYQNFSASTGLDPNPVKHSECVFFSPKWCGDGVTDSDNGEECDAGSNNGKPGSSCSATCRTDTTVPPPECSGLTVVPQNGPAPLAARLTCSASNAVPATNYLLNCGTPGQNFINPSATCNYPTAGTYSVSCSVDGKPAPAACQKTITVTPPTTPSGFNLALKKYINSTANDAQTAASAVRFSQNATFNYFIQVINNGPDPVTGTTIITDTLPAGIEPTEPNALNLSQTGGFGCTYVPTTRVLSCSTIASVSSGAILGTITLPVRVTVSSGTITNSATVSNPGDTNTTDNTDPAVIVVDPTPPTPLFNLALKKYINSTANDAQSNATAVSVVRNTLFTYLIQVTNNGPQAVSGTTEVTDTLPTGVSLSGAITSSPDWTCSVSGQNIRCSSLATPASGSRFSDIRFPVVVAPATPDSYITNSATVLNPGDTNTTDNTDPAVILIGSVPTDPSCTSISSSRSSSTNGSLTTEISCEGDARATSLQISCGIPGQLPVNIVGATGKTTCNYGNIGTFRPSCAINGAPQPTTGSCVTPVTISADPGSGIKCAPGLISSSSNVRSSNGGTKPNFVLNNPINNLTPDLCRSGENLTNFVQTLNGNNIVYTWTCNNFDGDSCTAIYNYGGGGCGSACDVFPVVPEPPTGPTAFCGDGIVQRDRGEVCDFGTARNGREECNSSCKFQTTTPGERSTQFVVTNPGRSISELPLQTYTSIVGRKVRVFSSTAEIAVSGTEPVDLTGGIATIVDASGVPLVTARPLTGCVGNGTIRSNPVRIEGTDSYRYQTVETCTPRVTLFSSSELSRVTAGNGARLELGIFVDPINHKQSSPIIGTTNGGAATLPGMVSIPDLLRGIDAANKIQLEPTTLSTKNLIPLPSDSTASKTSVEGLLKNITANDVLAPVGTNQNLLKVRNTTIPSSGVSYTGSKTILVTGKMTVNGDITLAPGASRAFIFTPGSSLFIDGDVKQISGIFVFLGDASVDGEDTVNQLKISGAFYGPIDNLLKHRWYVRAYPGDTTLQTGIIVDYNTSLLTNPPPLLSDFLNAYAISRK